MKDFLERNKIFFEITSMIVISTMEVIISVVGLLINIRSGRVNKRQVEISENDREPYFTIKCDPGEKTIQGYDYTYTLLPMVEA